MSHEDSPSEIGITSKSATETAFHAHENHDPENSLDLADEDRRFLQALEGKDHVATANTRHPLGLFSVVAFILQEMIGTGIFRTPWTVMQATQSTGVTMIFWAVGAITALAGIVLYIEFGLSLPRHLIDGKVEAVVRNGGDLNYLAYLFKRPKFFITCFYGLNYILLASSAVNAIAFGDDVLGGGNSVRSSSKDAAARGLAIIAITMACLLHAFTRRGGIILNNTIVVAKVAILCVFPIMAICTLSGVGNTNYITHNLKPSAAFADIHSSTDSYVQGSLAILYAYNGYNQANYVIALVLCEIYKPRDNLVKGILIAFVTTVVLYMLVNFSYMIVVSKEQQLQTSDISLQFLVNMIGEKRAPKVLAAFTGVNILGNIIGQTFTAARVKQEIAKEGVIPFAKFFGENRTPSLPRRPNSNASSENSDATSSWFEPTPLGALLLHWMFAMLLILATWSTRPAYAYRVLVSLASYVTDVIPGFIMGAGMLYLRVFTTWASKSMMPAWVSTAAASIFTLSNGFPLIAVWIPPPRHSVSGLYDLIPGFPWYMTGMLSWILVLCSVIYWAGFRYILPRIGWRRGKEFVVEREPVFRMQNGERVHWHEIVIHSWEVKDAPDRRMGYMLDDN